MTLTDLDTLAFEGEPFAFEVADRPAEPAPPATPGGRPVSPPPTVAASSTVPALPVAASPLPGTTVPTGATSTHGVVRELRAHLIAAHSAAMRTQSRFTDLALAEVARLAGDHTGWGAGDHTGRAAGTHAGQGAGEPTGREVPSARRTAGPATSRPVGTIPSEAEFKPLAHATTDRLGPAELELLAAGDVAGVFGPAYVAGTPNEIRLPAPPDLLLIEVADITRRGSAHGRGGLRARVRSGDTDPTAVARAARQAAQILAMHLGLHLCLPGARFAPADGAADVTVEPGYPQDLGTTPLDAVIDVVDVALVPRPWLRVDADLLSGDERVATVRGLTVMVVEGPGLPVGPAAGGLVAAPRPRLNRFGAPAMLNEFHLEHSSIGDLGIALGPEFTAYGGRRATRSPAGGLRLCDRVMAVHGTRGELTGGATGDTEYDAHGDAWYFREYASETMPNVVHMETSLQSALVLGYFLGATLTAPEEDYSLRNLDGEATLLRDVDLRGATITQRSRLVSTTVLVGAVLQSLAYELSVDDEPFYTGQSLFGFFNQTALANQAGLDSGGYVPNWLEAQALEAAAPAVRTIDVAARRARPRGTGPGYSSGPLALLDQVEVVDGGGRFGQGYLRATKAVDPGDWFFARHFLLDPVMPGSLGIEAVIQAMQEWLVDAGHAADLTNPEFVLPAGLPMSWRYRGQILATDRELTLEVHLKTVQHGPGRVRVVADASVWKPGLRIYELIDIAAELREPGAPQW
ncbi:MAG: beta-ketoacyl synthase [Frankia sp.]